MDFDGYGFGNFDLSLLPANFTIGDQDASEFYSYESGDDIETAADIPKENLAKIIFSLLICVFGVIGNLVAIFVIVVLKEYQKSVTHWYVLQLAIADSIFLLTLPFKVSEDWNDKWIFSDWMCKAKETILFLNYYASILFLVVMSFDRYIAVCHTFATTLQKLRKRASSFIIASCVWAVALLLCIPIMLYTFKRGTYPNCKCWYAFPKPIPIPSGCEDPHSLNEAKRRLCEVLIDQTEDQIYCRELTVDADLESIKDLIINNLNNSESIFFGSSSANGLSQANANVGTPSSHAACNYWNDAEGFRIFLILNFVAMFVLPLLVMVWCYGLIIKKLSDTRVPTQTPSASFTQSSNPPSKPIHKRKSSSRSNADRKRVTIMCAALVTCFIVCWLPFHSIHLAKIVGIRSTEGDLCNTLQIVGALLAYLNSAINPYLYSFLGTNFAKRWRTAAGTLRQTVSRHRNSSSNSGSMRHVHKRKDRKHHSTKTRSTKLMVNHNLDTKNSVSEASPACMEMNRPLTNHSDSRNVSFTRCYPDSHAQDYTNDYSSDYKHNFSTTES